MRKIYWKLTKEQKEAGVIFSSCLSPTRYETGAIHEVKVDDPDRENKIRNLNVRRMMKQRSEPDGK